MATVIMSIYIIIEVVITTKVVKVPRSKSLFSSDSLKASGSCAALVIFELKSLRILLALLTSANADWNSTNEGQRVRSSKFSLSLNKTALMMICLTVSYLMFVVPVLVGNRFLFDWHLQSLE